MKKALFALSMFLMVGSVFAQTVTPNIGLTQPAIGAQNWGTIINNDLQIIDNVFGGTPTAPTLSLNGLTMKSLVGGGATQVLCANNAGVVFSGGLCVAGGGVTFAGDLSGSSSTQNVIGLNGTRLSTLATGLLKNTTGTGIPSIASPGTDYAPATSGNAILYGNGSGGFLNVTIGSNVTFAGGVLSATAGASAPAFPVNPQSSTYAVVASDFSNCKAISIPSGTFVVTLVAGGSQPAGGQCVWILNYGTGVITIANNGQNINGVAGSLTLGAGSPTAPTGAFVISDGANYEAQVFGNGIGTVTTTGSPTTNGLALFSGATTITSGNLSQDVTTANSLVATVVGLNNTNLAGLSTGLLKNTTGTGVPSIVALPLSAANGGSGISNTATLTLGSSNVNLATLATGILTNTITTGALGSIAPVGVKCYPFQGSGGTGCDTPAGSGTVTSSGSPLIHQLSVFTTATNIQGISVGATNTVLHGVTGADPSFSAVVDGDFSGQLTAAHGGTGVSNTATLTLGSSNQNWATLATGIVTNTITTGALGSIAPVGAKCYPFQGSGGTGCDNPAGSGTVTTSGSPAANTIALFTAGSVIGNSSLTQNGSDASILGGNTINWASASTPTQSGGNLTCNLASSNYCAPTVLSANITALTLSNPHGSGPYCVKWTQGGITAYSVSFSGSGIQGGATPNIALGTHTEQCFTYDGTNYWPMGGAVAGDATYGYLPTHAAPADGNPPVGFVKAWVDSTSLGYTLLDSNGNYHSTPLTSLAGVVSIAGGGTGATTQQSAFEALAPTATIAGSVIYWNGTHYVKLDGNASGTNCLQENSSGVPSWAACGSGGASALSSITAATGANTIANGDNDQTWQWSQTTASTFGMLFTESSASSATTSGLVKIATLANSTIVPLTVSNSLGTNQTTPALSITPTWNTTGVVTGALSINVTNAASGASSLLANFAVGGSSKFSVDKSGVVTMATALAIAQGGTGATTQQSAFDALAPTATRAGDVTYWNGSHYVNLAGNNAGTQVFTENASGVPSWGAGSGNTYNGSGVSGSAASVTFSGTQYLTLNGGLAPNSTESAVQMKIGVVATIANACANIPSIAGSSSVTFSLQANGSPAGTPGTVSMVVNSSTPACDNTNSYTTSAGDLMDWKVVSTGVPGANTPAMVNMQIGTGGITGGGTATDLAYWSSSTGLTNTTGFTVIGTTLSAAASGNLDLSAGASFKIPVSAGCTVSANGQQCFDTTNKQSHDFTNGADSIRAAFPSASLPTNGQLAYAVVASSNVVLKGSPITTDTTGDLTLPVGGGATLTVSDENSTLSNTFSNRACAPVLNASNATDKMSISGTIAGSWFLSTCKIKANSLAQNKRIRFTIGNEIITAAGTRDAGQVLIQLCTAAPTASTCTGAVTIAEQQAATNLGIAGSTYDQTTSFNCWSPTAVGATASLNCLPEGSTLMFAGSLNAGGLSSYTVTTSLPTNGDLYLAVKFIITTHNNASSASIAYVTGNWDF